LFDLHRTLDPISTLPTKTRKLKKMHSTTWTTRMRKEITITRLNTSITERETTTMILEEEAEVETEMVSPFPVLVNTIASTLTLLFRCCRWWNYGLD